jgi:hypothetical protein
LWTNKGGIIVAKTKYGELFLKEPWGKPRQKGVQAPTFIQIGEQAAKKGWGEPLHMVLRPIYQPITMGGDKGHTHPDAEILFFIGGNPMDFKDFGAEVELAIGEEFEKHIIKTTTFVYIPKGLLHCPLVFRNVERPIMFGHIMSNYAYVSDRPD